MYAFEPMPTNVPPQLQSFILGAQGNLWTEQIPNFKHVEYMTFPRICALAEVTWSAKDARDWNDFLRRLQVETKRLEELNINYRRLTMQ